MFNHNNVFIYEIWTHITPTHTHTLLGFLQCHCWVFTSSSSLFSHPYTYVGMWYWWSKILLRLAVGFVGLVWFSYWDILFSLMCRVHIRFSKNRENCIAWYAAAAVAVEAFAWFQFFLFLPFIQFILYWDYRSISALSLSLSLFVCVYYVNPINIWKHYSTKNYW